MTQAMKVASAGSSIVAEIEIAAPPDIVFDALTTPADLAAWWGAEGVYRTHDWKLDLRPGGEWSCLATQAGTGAVMTVRGHLPRDRPAARARLYLDAELGEGTARHRGPLHPLARVRRNPRAGRAHWL